MIFKASWSNTSGCNFDKKGRRLMVSTLLIYSITLEPSLSIELCYFSFNANRACCVIKSELIVQNFTRHLIFCSWFLRIKPRNIFFYINRNYSKLEIQDVFWTTYVRSIYVLCLRGRCLFRLKDFIFFFKAIALICLLLSKNNFLIVFQNNKLIDYNK